MAESTELTVPVAPLAGPLASERVVLAAPMSFSGSLARISGLGLTRRTANPYGRAALILLVVSLVTVAWVSILVWYMLFGLLLVPYRLIRRSQRKEQRDALMHREQLAAIARKHSTL